MTRIVFFEVSFYGSMFEAPMGSEHNFNTLGATCGASGGCDTNHVFKRYCHCRIPPDVVQHVSLCKHHLLLVSDVQPCSCLRYDQLTLVVINYTRAAPSQAGTVNTLSCIWLKCLWQLAGWTIATSQNVWWGNQHKYWHFPMKPYNRPLSLLVSSGCIDFACCTMAVSSSRWRSGGELPYLQVYSSTLVNMLRISRFPLSI